MIRPVQESETEALLNIINAGAQAYCGVIPGDCWHEPYMSSQELNSELEAGVRFWGWEDDGCLVGVMGRQDLEEVILIRHAYVHPDCQRRGIGAQLLTHLLAGVDVPVLVGTWILFCLIIALLYFSAVISDLKGKIKELSQKIALMELEMSDGQADGPGKANSTHTHDS